MLARWHTGANLYIGDRGPIYPYCLVFSQTVAGGPYQYIFTLDKLAPHFPYGWDVDPDH